MYQENRISKDPKFWNRRPCRLKMKNKQNDYTFLNKAVTKELLGEQKSGSSSYGPDLNIVEVLFQSPKLFQMKVFRRVR